MTHPDGAAPARAGAASGFAELAEARWRAIGTGVHLVVAGGALEPARAAVETLLAVVDTTYSRFRDDSELSRIHRDGRETVVSPLLAQAIEAALRGARLSDGLVDPTVGRALRAIGYDVDFAQLARRAPGDAPTPIRITSIPGWQAIRFDAHTRRLAIPNGVELDLGSTGKALAADLGAAAALAALSDAERAGPTRAPGRAGGPGVLLSLGGDITLAGTPPPGGWRILAADSSETDPATGGEVVALDSGAVATSSTTVRRWVQGAVARHHLIDPRTGEPAAGPWRTVSVIAATCVDANIAATAAIIRGDDAPGWLEALGLPARLVADDGTIARVGGWPEPSGPAEPA
jgi:thiamine biosynthesis lipoprotein